MTNKLSGSSLDIYFYHLLTSQISISKMFAYSFYRLLTEKQSIAIILISILYAAVEQVKC